ncbi:MAG: FAD:protein FMN transferase [Tepidisphaeraceae bacterium]|jgi:thiamine biosynthesis lipoprotein
MKLSIGWFAAMFTVLSAAGCRSHESAPTTRPIQPVLQRWEYRQLSMGVAVRLVLYAPDEDTAFNAAKDAYARVASINEAASDYKLDSELMRLCKKSGQGPVKVGDDLYTLLEKSVEVSRRSHGVFDCTVGPLVKLWRAARKSGKLPAAEDIEKARALVGWEKIRLDPQNRTAELLEPRMQLDMGGIAKGYAGDKALETLAKHGVTRALFEAGGDLVLGDAPPNQKGWKIEITGGREGPDQVLELANCAVSTSGDTEQFVEIDGKHYSHVVDPRTGLGVTSRLLVTLIMRKGLDADPLSKMCGVLGEEGAAELMRAYPEARVFLRHPKQ